MADDALVAMIADACFGLASDEEFSRDLRGFLERHRVAAEDVEAIMASPMRLGVYRRLVRNNLYEVTCKMLPRTRARLSELAGNLFEQSFREYLDEVGPQTHYLRDVPGEFVAWATSQWTIERGFPGYAGDLARFEVLEFQVAAMVEPTGPTGHTGNAYGEPALDKALVFRALRVESFCFAVHELDAHIDARDVPREGRTYLLLYRDRSDAVMHREVSPLMHDIFRRLLDGQALAVSVTAAGTARKEAVTSDVLNELARLLADLAELDVLLGAPAG